MSGYDKEILPVYSASMDSVGLLGPEVCRDLARHYSLVHSFLAQCAMFNAQPDPDCWPPEALQDLTKSHLRLVEDVYALQPALIGQLDAVASETTMDWLRSLIRR